MDQYLERIATALERIAEAVTKPVSTTVMTGGLSLAADIEAGPTPPATAAKAKTGRPAKAAAPVEEPKQAEAPKQVTLLDISTTIQKIIAKKKEDRSKVVTVLGQFGVSRIGDLKPDQFPAVFSKIEEIFKAIKQ